jgi:dimethylsulfone monooxygenase
MPSRNVFNAAVQPGNPMRNANRLKLGLFAPNCSSGLAVTKAPERWDASWPHNVQLAQLCDAAGIEFLLPIARWRGYGGETDFEGETWETITWAAGLLAATRHLTVFGTVHVALVHPIFAAKQFVTVDHIGAGRFGLNIVCGWNQDDFDMFGVAQREHDSRYDYGEEWWTIVRRIWTSDAPFDFAGRYISLKAVIGKPKPRALPVVMNAGASGAGRAFGARNCDFLFTKLVDMEQGRTEVTAVKDVAAGFGRAVDVFASSHVVLRPTRKQADEYYRWYSDEQADWEAVDRLIMLQGLYTQSLPPDGYKKFRQRFAAGHGTYPLVGDADHIAAELHRMSQIGFAGTAMGFVNYLDEFPAFAAEVLPRLERLGLREPATAVA